MASVAALLVLTGCGGGPDALPEYELSGSAMGTAFSVKLVAPPPDLDPGELQQHIEGRLAAIEGSMSTYRLESEVSRFNAYDGTGWFEISAALCGALQDAMHISELTGGSFDITVGPLVNLWGFGPDGAVVRPPDARRVAALLERVGYARLHTDCSRPAVRKDVPGLFVDLSAYAKGLAADRIAAILDDRRVGRYLVEIGGELHVRGKNSRGEDWAIAIEKPARTNRSVQTVVAITDAAMATSGDYRNFFEHEGRYYSHTIDPRTGYPVSHDTASVTVIAESTAFADAMATALLVLGREAGMELAEREGLPAYFQVRSGDRIEEHMTEEFAELLPQR